DVDHVAAGDRIVAAFIMPCGSCRHCTNDLEEICEVFFENNRINGRLLDGTTRLHEADGTDVAMYSMAGHTSRTVVPASAVLDRTSITWLQVIGLWQLLLCRVVPADIVRTIWKRFAKSFLKITGSMGGFWTVQHDCMKQMAPT